VVDERLVVVEGGLRHVLKGPDILDIEDTFTGSRSPK
jgi:hypothetical protein